MRFFIALVLAFTLALTHASVSQTSVVLVTPTLNSEDVAVSTDIQIVFSDQIDHSTVSGNTVKILGNTVGYYSFTSSYTVATKTLTLTPAAPFKHGEHVSVVVTGDVEDQYGNPVLPFLSEFKAEYVGGLGTFTQTSVLPCGNTPEGIGTTDLDGDGDLDFIVASYYSGSVFVYENVGNGVITQRANISIGSLPQAVPVAIGDFDNDGDNDFGVPCRGSGYVALFWNNGGWSFSVSYLTIGGSPIGATTGDLDRDGDIDLVVGNLSDIRIFHNNGAGVFSHFATLSPGGSPHTATLSDIDNDGDLDLAVPRYWAGSVAIYMNDGTSVFSHSATYAVGSQPRTVEPADYDLDGDIDFAVANSTSSFITILENNGSGAFTGTNIPASPIPHTTTSIDIEGDGDADLLISNGLILVNDGTGGFTPLGTTFAHEYPVVGDFDGDGDADIARVSNTAHVIRILLNDDSNTPPVADAGDNSVFECTSISGASVLLDGSGSVDPDGDPLEYVWRIGTTIIAGPTTSNTSVISLPVGTYDITLTVKDSFDAEDTDAVTVSVEDNTPPVISSPQALTYPTDIGSCSRLGENVILIAPTATDICSASISMSNDAPSSYPLGTTIITWTATDQYGNFSTADQAVTIIDQEAPSISVSVSPAVLWPPNHALISITATVSVSDNCQSTYTLYSVTSNEPDNGLGDGDTDNDIQGHDIGTPDNAFQLRAERAGGGSGRIYTITYRAIDGSGNATYASTTVFVPHSAPAKSIAVSSEMPVEFRLAQNYPNPFNPSTTIRYSIPEDGIVTLRVMNQLGQVVADLVDGHQVAGTHEAIFNAQGLPSGIYIGQLMWKDRVLSQRMTLLK